jgi:hypothetical protein
VFGEFAALTGPSQDQDLRVVHEPVGDRGGHRGRVKHLSPVSKGPMRGNHRGLPLVPLADDLEEEVCPLWAKGKIPQRVTDQEGRCGVMLELLQQRVSGRRRDARVDHGNGRGKEPLDIGVAGGIGQALRQEGCARTGIANEHDIAVGGDEVEVAQRQEAGFLLLSRCMVVKVELIKGQFFCAGRWAPPEVPGVRPAVLQVEVSQESEGRNHVEILLGGLLSGRVEVLEHAFEPQVCQLVLSALAFRHDGVLLMTKASSSSREGAARRMALRWGCLSRTGGCCLWGGISW